MQVAGFFAAPSSPALIFVSQLPVSALPSLGLRPQLYVHAHAAGLFLGVVAALYGGLPLVAQLSFFRFHVCVRVFVALLFHPTEKSVPACHQQLYDEPVPFSSRLQAAP